MICDILLICSSVNVVPEGKHNHKLKSFSAYECEWGYLNNERTWQHNKDCPILAKRDLKYNILTRFFKRPYSIWILSCPLLNFDEFVT